MLPSFAMESWGKEIWERKSKEQDGLEVSGGFMAKVQGRKAYIESKKRVERKLLRDFKIKKRNIKNILEIGPGTDALTLNFFLDQGFKVDILDVSENTIRLLKKNFPIKGMKFYEQDITEMKLNKKYDLIFCLGTFLHIPAHLSLIAMNNFNKGLKKGGYLVLDFPIRQPLTLKKALWEGAYITGHRMKQKLGKKVYNTTTSDYTRKEVKDIIERTGFKAIKESSGLWLLKKIK